MAYDYVLAGGGSAGATLAARLSEDHKITVCLIEAGGEGRSVVVRAPIGVAAMLSALPVLIPIVIVLIRKIQTTEVQL